MTFTAVFKQELDVPLGGGGSGERVVARGSQGWKLLCGDNGGLEAEVTLDLTTWEPRPSLLGLSAMVFYFAFSLS